MSAQTKGEPRARHRWVEINGRRVQISLLANCDVEIRERFARRGVTIEARELVHKHDQLKGGLLFPP